MRLALGILLFAALAGCPASHKRKSRDRASDAATMVLDGGDEEDLDEPDATVEDVDAEGDTSSYTDAASADAAPGDAATVRAEIVSPGPAAQFYAFEDVPFQGACHGAPVQGVPSARFVATGPAPAWHLDGAAGSHRFDLPGSYTVELICRADSGEEQRGRVDLTIRATPQIAYAAKAPGAQSEAVFAARLDQLGQATQISPQSEARAAKITGAQYNAAADRVLVSGNLFDRQQQVLAILKPCREADCVGREVAYEALVPEAHACQVRFSTWSPDGRSIFASFTCPSSSAGATSYWIDLSGATARVHALGKSPMGANSDGSGDFTAGGDVLVFQTGSELKALDTRAAEHPVVSLGSVANARWLVSSARDRVLVLGDQGYTLSASELMAEGAGARRPIPYDHGAPRALEAGDTHLRYILERTDADGQPFYEHWLMRWDGSRDTKLCAGCTVNRCGDRIMLRLDGEPAYLLRIAPGATSDLAEKIPLGVGAPQPLNATSFDGQCTLAVYQSGQFPNPTILWDTTTGEWLATPWGMLAPDGRHLASDTSLRPVERMPLRVLAPVIEWGSGNPGTFSPDGKHYVVNGRFSTGAGTYHIDLQTYRVERLAGQPQVVSFSADGTRLLGAHVRDFDQRLAEYALPAPDPLWRSERGAADWGTLYNFWDVRMVPGARAIAYRGKLSADGAMSVYRSDLDQGGTQRFGGQADTWEVSSDGKLLGTRNAQEIALWSFEAKGAGAPLARKELNPSMDCLTFEVGSDGLLCVGRGVGQLYWLDARSGGVGELALPWTMGSYWRGTRGPDGAARGMLFSLTDRNNAASWLDFTTPTTPRVEGAPETGQWWILTRDRRYLLRGAVGPTIVTDLATGTTRTLAKAGDGITIPVPYEYYARVEDKGRMVFSNDYQLFWLDLDAAVVTASPTVGAVLTLYRLGSDLSRVLVLNEARDRLEVVAESGQRITMYKDAGNPIRGVSPSPDGRKVAFSTEAAAFVAFTDGSSQPVRVSSAIDWPRFDDTGRFLVGVELAQPDVVGEAVLKVWKLDTPGSFTRVSPAGFAPWGSLGALWIQ
jgi:hypothetical protein